MKVSRFTRYTAILNGAVPVVLLGWDALTGELGANPVNSAIRTTGMLALIFIVLSLLVTPAITVTGWSWLGPFRRPLGLYGFFHAALHFLLFFGLDREWSIGSTLSEVVKRPYLGVGMFALILMIPLAVTSTDAMVKRLGLRWKMLHRLAYPIALAAVIHYYMLVKADATQPLEFAGVVGILLWFRGVVAFRKGRPGGPGKGPWKGKLKVARIVAETPGVSTFRLVTTDGSPLPFRHLPGQHLNLLLTIGGKKVQRSYTIASSPSQTDYCELTVKREDMGVSSRHLHDMIREGTLIEIKAAPAGNFTFTGEEAKSIVLLAGGVGITPLMSKIRHLTDIAWPGEIHLIFAARTEADIIFRAELDDLQKRFPNLHVTYTLTRADESSWQGERGRITAELLDRVVPDLKAKRIHICGPDSMNEAMVPLLEGMGVPADNIKLESFGVGSGGAASGVVTGPELVADPSASAGVTFAASGMSKEVAPDETILEASEALGIDIPYDCRSGTCGTCKTKLISGRVMMDTDAALSKSDREKSMILACQSHCIGPVVVEA